MPFSSGPTGFACKTRGIVSCLSEPQPILLTREDTRWVKEVTSAIDTGSEVASFLDELSELEGLFEALRRLNPLTRELKKDPNERSIGR
ncbi:MAG: hypothetical protein Q9209_006222 [Squamulea sp. 1 TL-2023]